MTGIAARRPGQCGFTIIETLVAGAAAGALAGLVDLTFIKDWVRCGFWLAVGLGLAVGRSVSRERPSSPA